MKNDIRAFKKKLEKFKNINRRKIILASSSKRREKILNELGLNFKSVSPKVEEDKIPNDNPYDFVEEVAERKADFVAKSCLKDEIIIAADTVAVYQNKIIGKPEDDEDARRILKKLSGTQHEVVSGICILDLSTKRRLVKHARTKLKMKMMSDEQIDEYVNSGESQGKAGAYAVQESGDEFVDVVEGSFWNVVGFPIELFIKILEEIDEI